MNSKFIIDGVQAELNPEPYTCRANLGSEIRNCFTALQTQLAKDKGKFTACFEQTVIITKENLMDLNEQSRQFGCAPSKSIYNNKTSLKIDKVDGTEYLTRAAGGHIHIGHLNDIQPGAMPRMHKALTTDHEKTVKLLDIICGNTFVMIDRDKGNIERRKLYGRAGEFRLPKHGLEYRTLSNFWLTSYPIMSLAFGLARLSAQLIADPTNSAMFFDTFTSKVKQKNIEDAINNNDYDLACENFNRVKDLIAQVTLANENFPLNEKTIPLFEHFANKINQEGIQYWFPKDPMYYWTSNAIAFMGFHDFCNSNVKNDIKKKAA